jgi:hypothetical protein
MSIASATTVFSAHLLLGGVEHTAKIAEKYENNPIKAKQKIIKHQIISSV